MQPAKSLPQAACFSTEEKIHLLSGSCPRNLSKDILIEWSSFRKGTEKDGRVRSELTKVKKLHYFLLLIIATT